MPYAATDVPGFSTPWAPAVAEEAAPAAGAHLSGNRAGRVFADRSAAFGDVHGSAAGPDGAIRSGAAFVTGRPAALRSRRPAVAAPEESA
ncbi:hypothetical protein [Streptomyces hygroscopicus]|uniref:hypothetical protein n=1 Tax=Streptomyces hygroscopicus TaxID=1912 RepID=UPI0007DB1D29|nr:MULTISPECIES: hypothetical protein [Streptomyces]MBW8090466.1 hypothetical protein [Streptomyces hygroscopicus subsp. hygroscopicus]